MALQEYSTNLGLSQSPEFDQKKYPELFSELQRVRNALRVLQAALDQYTGTLSEQQDFWSQTPATKSLRVQGMCRVYCIATATFALGELVNFLDDAGVTKAQHADATPGIVLPAQAFCSTSGGVAIGDYGEFTLLGAMPYFTGLLGGALLYLNTTPGQITASPPGASGSLLQQIGYVVSPNVIWFNPSGTWQINP